MNFSFDFSGKNVFVFGGTSGINLGIAESFAAAGAQLGVASRNQDKVNAAVARLSKPDAPALGFSLDVREPQAVADALASFVQSRGKIDVLVSGAAGNFPAAAASLSPNGFKSVVDIDLLGTYNCSKCAFEKWMRANGGNIVNIAAAFELKGIAFQAHVAAAKSGVLSLTRTCAVEWGPYGVRVNGVNPGSTGNTEGVRRFAEAVRGGDSRPTNPMGVMSHGQDIALCVLFLVSPSARHVSGQVISVDGGGSVDQLKMTLPRD